MTLKNGHLKKKKRLLGDNVLSVSRCYTLEVAETRQRDDKWLLKGEFYCAVWEYENVHDWKRTSGHWAVIYRTWNQMKCIYVTLLKG